MRIGLDLDGVCYEWQRTYMYMLRAYRGYSRDLMSDIESWTHWNWHKENVSKQDNDWMWSEGIRLGLFRYGHLYPGTVKAVNELSSLGDVVVITSRPKRAAQDTFDWISYNKLPVQEVHITNGGNKSDIKPVCDVYIDDGPHVIDDLIDNTPSAALLWDRPWNRTPSRCTARVSTWDEVLNFVEGMKKARK